MKYVRQAKDRGHADHGWLKSAHTFSFADYYDPNFMGFSSLRVINEDFVDGGEGFPTHPHRDMEIITYLVDGSLQHKDSMGNSEVLNPGEVQRMSAGTGVRHSEFNPDQEKAVHLFQIWIMPSEMNIEPSYEQRSFAKLIEKGGLVKVAEPASQAKPGEVRPRQDLENLSGSPVRIHQDAHIYVGKIKSGESISLPLGRSRNGWLQMVEGQLEDQMDGSIVLSSSDALALTEESTPQFTAKKDSHFIFFDLK